MNQNIKEQYPQCPFWNLTEEEGGKKGKKNKYNSFLRSSKSVSRSFFLLTKPERELKA
jgi:hypothetical protein